MGISAIDAAGSTSAVNTSSGLTGMKTEDFLQILVTEMQNQDPFEPSDTSDLINQVSQIRSIEQSDALTNSLGLMTDQQRIGGTSELIGKFVQAIATAADGSQSLHEGVVTSVYFNSEGQAVIELDTGDAVRSEDIVRITTPEQFEAELAGASADGEESDADDEDEAST